MTPPPEQGSRRFSICQAFADPPSSFRSSPWCPSFRMSSPRARKSVRIAAPALSLQWDSPCKCTSILASDIPLREQLETPISSTTVAPGSSKNPNPRSYFGLPDLDFYFGPDIPIGASICANGLCSLGQQTQLHCRSFLYKYPYLHPVAVFHTLVFLWFMDWNIRIVTTLTAICILFMIGESLRIARQASMETYTDVIKTIA